MNSSQIAALRNNPTAIVAAINEALAQVAFLRDTYESITGVPLPAVPAFIATPIADGVPDVLYGPNGLSEPRADGAVRAQAWDEAVDAALASADPATVRWGRANENRRWLFIQDTLDRTDLTRDQRDTIILNCSDARFINGLGGKGSVFKAWKASPLTRNDHGPLLQDAEITDAFALPSDLTFPDGRVRWVGARARDIAAVAKASLQHYLLTSGGATQPLRPGVFGAR